MDKNILRKYIPNNSVILDAGAFNGGDTNDFLNMFPECLVLAFEPVSELYKTLTNSITVHKERVKTFNIALDNSVGKKEMYISSGYSNQSSSLMKPKEHLNMFPECKFEKKEIVNTTTINQFCKDNNVDRIDFMWLDLQGNEFNVLNCADEILHTTKAIFAEYSLVEFYEGLKKYDEFKEFMDSIGFYEAYNENVYNSIGCGNSLFVKK